MDFPFDFHVDFAIVFLVELPWDYRALRISRFHCVGLHDLGMWNSQISCYPPHFPIDFPMDFRRSAFPDFMAQALQGLRFPTMHDFVMSRI